MANVLPRDKQIQIISALVEGVSIRSIERMTGVHRDTIMRLMVKVGQACEALHNKIMCELPCEAIEIDEIWGFVAKKQRNVDPTKDNAAVVGDAWTFVAIDADTKLIPAFRTGKRDSENTRLFIQDLASRLTNRVQISSDAFVLYAREIDATFESAVDYATVVKTYESDPVGTGNNGKYSPGRVTSIEKTAKIGSPDLETTSTSYVERQNLTIRMSNRRMTRLTNAFSKKLENHKAAMALHFANYNLCRVHRTLRVTPAMAAGVTDTVWTVANLVDVANQ
jgi:IS1 family transposase